jgi:hypothetical protein
MPPKFWDEAYLTTVFLINRTLSCVISYQTHMERLLGHKPNYSLLHMFGCACWPNRRPYNSRKLSFRSQRCVFLGHSNQHKGYKCLEPSSDRVYISRDVIFDETTFPFSSLHVNDGAHLQAKILLLHQTLHNTHEGVGVDMPNMINAADGIADSYVGVSAALGDQNSAAVPSDLILLDHEQIGSALVSGPDHCMGYALWAVPFVPTTSVLCLAVALRSSASMVSLPPLADCAASSAAIPDPAPAPNLVVMPDPAIDALVFFVPSGSTASAPTHPTTCLQNNIKNPRCTPTPL